MPRVYGYAPLGQRCYDVHDWQARGRVNAVGALCNSSLITVCLFEGSINADVFYSWVTNALLPSVPQNTVIIMDNARFHKRHDTIEVLQNAHLNVEFLPPYSPDLNPIEKKVVPQR
jgi:transposase